MGEYVDGARGVIKGRDPDTLEAVPLGTEKDGQVTRVALFCWDPGTVSWVRMKQPTIEYSGDLTVTMGDVEALLANNYWKDKRFDNDVDGNPVYIGFHTTHKASEGASTWYIVKYTWDVDGNLTRIEGPLVGSWTGRAGLSWG